MNSGLVISVFYFRGNVALKVTNWTLSVQKKGFKSTPGECSGLNIPFAVSDYSKTNQ
jgi:hypothetical protein